MQNVKIDNKPKLLSTPKKVIIDDKNYIKISEYQKRNYTYFDVAFNNCGNEIFIGRYAKNYENINAMYNDGKILVYSGNSNNITNVYSLYDILDGTYYSVCELEALKLFNPNLDSSKLKDKERLIVRCDVEKRHRLVKKS